MKNNYLKEIVLSLVVVALAVLLIDPLMLWMPNTLVMALVAIFAIAFFVFGIFVWKERAADERESVHKNIAGRIAFLVGASILALGIVVQSFSHWIDPWLVAALTLMVLAKILGYAYTDKVN